MFRAWLLVALVGMAACAEGAPGQGELALELSGDAALAARDGAARQLARLIGEPGARRQLVMALAANRQLPLSAQALGLGSGALDDAVARMRIAEESAVPEVWLHRPAGLRADTEALLVAYEPAGEDTAWTEIPAYRPNGERVLLDARRAPDVPVLVVASHGRLAMRANIERANRALRKAGLQRQVPAPKAARARHWTVKLDAVRLKDDMEPWVSGDAEIYAIASGVLNDNAPQLRVVELPYLQEDQIAYSPGQLVVDWQDYRYQVANFQLFEQDDNHNYQELVTAIVDAIGAGGSMAGYPEVQAITEIANRIIAAMPAGWFTNDDDYVDSFYTLERERSYAELHGAAQNATIHASPFELIETE